VSPARRPIVHGLTLKLSSLARYLYPARAMAEEQGIEDYELCCPSAPLSCATVRVHADPEIAREVNRIVRETMMGKGMLDYKAFEKAMVRLCEHIEPMVVARIDAEYGPCEPRYPYRFVDDPDISCWEFRVSDCDESGCIYEAVAEVTCGCRYYAGAEIRVGDDGVVDIRFSAMLVSIEDVLLENGDEGDYVCDSDLGYIEVCDPVEDAIKNCHCQYCRIEELEELWSYCHDSGDHAEGNGATDGSPGD